MPMTPEPMQSRSEPLPVVDEYRARCGVGVYLAVTFGLAWLIGLYAVLFGVLLIIVGLRLRGMREAL